VKKSVQTDQAPKALGPYAQAIVANGMVYCAGQIPLDPKTGDIVAGGTLKPEELARFLEGRGYVRAGTVMEPGEYAMRGGINRCWPTCAPC